LQIYTVPFPFVRTGDGRLKQGFVFRVFVAVVFDPPTIETTLRALGLPVRAPPIAPARSRQLLDCSNGNDWTGVDVDYGWPD